MKLTESALRRIIREEIEGLEEAAGAGLAKFKVQDSAGKTFVYPTPNTMIFKDVVAGAMLRASSPSTKPSEKKSALSVIEDYKNSQREANPGEDEYMYVRDPAAIGSIKAAIAAGGVADSPWKVGGFSRGLRRDSVGFRGNIIPGDVESLSDEEKAAAEDLGTLMVASHAVAAAAPEAHWDGPDTKKERSLKHLDMAAAGVGPYKR